MESALVFLLYTYVLCFKFIIAIGSMFFLNWFHLYLPLFQIMVMKTRQKKIKIEPVLKILHQN